MAEYNYLTKKNNAKNHVITKHLPITSVKEIISQQAKDMPRAKL